MTRAHQDAHWSDAPSLSQLWLAALLRLLAMLVSNVAATVRMIASVLSGECHTDVDPADLPQPKHDPTRETNLAAPHSETQSALMVSSEAGLDPAERPSNQEGVLTIWSNSATVLLPRAGEAQGARAAGRQRSGGGRLPRSIVRAVPHLTCARAFTVH